MRDHHQPIADLGAELVVVGSGSPAQARAFRQEHDHPFRCLVDPELEAYRAAGLRRSFWATFSPLGYLSYLRAKLRGHSLGGVQGDPWQQGGAFVVIPAGETAFAHVNRRPGDHVDVERVLEVLRGLA